MAPLENLYSVHRVPENTHIFKNFIEITQSEQGNISLPI